MRSVKVGCGIDIEKRIYKMDLIMRHSKRYRLKNICKRRGEGGGGGAAKSFFPVPNLRHIDTLRLAGPLTPKLLTKYMYSGRQHL